MGERGSEVRLCGSWEGCGDVTLDPAEDEVPTGLLGIRFSSEFTYLNTGFLYQVSVA